ncbi:MAG: pitrilysin family protein [Candidatus Aminicenantes bacterium]|nr:pitrilysin family protein [Candidatus Aminicenantes bacterium]
MTAKKINGLFALVLVVFVCSFRTQAGEAVKNKYFVLENGLRVFLEENDKIPLVNIAAAVNVGSKDEEKEFSGLVHLLEHLVLFAGSHSASAAELTERIRKNGIYFNAHTGHDLMTVEISVPSEYAPAAFTLLREKLFNLALTRGELEKEKIIILEELSQQKDEPVTLGIQLALRELFRGHPYEKPVGGEKTSIENVTLESLERFYKKYLIPANCALSVVGDFKSEIVEETIKQGIGNVTVPAGAPIPLSQPVFPMVSSLKKSVETWKELDITQAHLFMGFIAPGLNRADKLPMDILTRILGKGVNPLLYNAFKSRGRPVDSLDIQYFPLNYGGAVLVHLTLAAKKIPIARTQLVAFLRDLKSYRFSKKDYQYRLAPGITDYLETSKAWMQLVYRQHLERESNLAVSYARYMLMHDNNHLAQLEKHDQDQRDYSQQLKTIQSSEIQEVAADYFSGRKYVMIAIVPGNNKDK